MPRLANSTRSKPAPAAIQQRSAPLQSPLNHRIPLNDDRQEKAVRLQSRQALQDLQMNSLKAAASPVRKLNNYSRAASDSPKTPRSHAPRGKENKEDGGLAVTSAGAMTPVKRVPILANFEEWMKMATDNKINATNSWNFALIDYFHDMSLLKEGDGVNFQKASCTLDGCVKIYTSRVDSVATETGKLLSGLAESRNQKRGKGGDGTEEKEDGEDSEEAQEGEDGTKKKTRRKVQRSSEATLAPSFASLQLKKFELEFSVDPLFKKTSADFDEGGAKGLLLNHLAIDSTGRIVFDSSDDAEDASAGVDSTERRNSTFAEVGCEKAEAAVLTEVEENQPESIHVQSKDIDIGSLGIKFFPDLKRLDEQDICPSLKDFDLGDPEISLDIPLLKAPEDWRQECNSPKKGNLGDQTGVFLDGDNVAGFEDDEGDLAAFDLGGDAGFGGGGEAWVKTAAIEPQMHMPGIGFPDGEMGGSDAIAVGDFDPRGNEYAVSLDHRKGQGDHDDILSYFDNALQKNWAGPEHWRIRRIKDTTKPSAPPLSRKQKEPHEIDFAAPLDPVLAEMIFTPAASNAAISLPKSQWKSKTRNLLPDDKHFDSRQLLRLFLKPKARIGSQRQGLGSWKQRRVQDEVRKDEMDEAFWARKGNAAIEESVGEASPQGDYDANFFQDDGVDFPNIAPDGDDDFVDAGEILPPESNDKVESGSQPMHGAAAGAEGGPGGAYGMDLVTQSRRLRPEYVQYARVAKKVDVRRLKEEMWRGIGLEEPVDCQTPTVNEPPGQREQQPLTFTSVMNNLQKVYPQKAMADISTSYCFICLLHLANEKGLSLGNEPGLEELSIRKDHTAEITEGDA